MNETSNTITHLDEILEVLPRVTSPSFFTTIQYGPNKLKVFHPEGLFSEQIFGPVNDYVCQCGLLEGLENKGERCPRCGVECTTSSVRKRRFAVIELPFRIPIPAIILNLGHRLKRFTNVENVDYTRLLISFFLKKPYEEVTEAEYYQYSTRFILVLPPELRPFIKEQNIIDVLNNEYKIILSKIKSVENELMRNEMVKSVILSDLFKSLKSKISGKESFIRKYMLGKRIPSARAVVTPDPYLKSDTIRIPFKLAAKIFEPVIINKMVPDFSAEKISEEIEKIYHEIPSSLHKEILETLENISENYKVLINRQPTLHTSSIQAYKFKITHDDTLQVTDIIAPPFNLDHDGDSFLGKVTILNKEGEVVFQGEIKDFVEKVLPNLF